MSNEELIHALRNTVIKQDLEGIYELRYNPDGSEAADRIEELEAKLTDAEQRGYANAMEAERKLHEARIEELEAKLKGAVSECERIGRLWHDAEAKLATCEEIGRAFEEDAGQLREKLAKAVEALEGIARPKVGPDFDWPEEEVDRWRAVWYRKYGEIARTTLAELKGETDE